MMTLMLAAPALGAGPRHDGAQLLKDLRRLSVVGGVLYVAAHPDDENTRLLATFANESLLRTAYLAFTRGEGGQNLVGPQLGPLLGVIRTQELLAARRLDGAEQYFTRARDFGYSKSIDETLAVWDHDRVLADAVWVIRSLRPDVIITRFPLEGTDTHGHHTASTRLAVEAFHAAADPRFHPEQLDRVAPWQARRIVWNAWTPESGTKPANAVQWDSSQYSALLGLSYGELAAESRSMHKSQGFGAAAVHGPSVESFVPLDGEPASTSLFEGIETSWKRVAGTEKLAALLDRAVAEYRVDQPASSIPTLLLALEELRRLPPNPFRDRKLGELVDVIADCAGLFVEATSPSFSVVPGGKLEVDVVALNRSATALKLEELEVGGTRLTPLATLERGKANQQKLTHEVPASAAYSTPYWLELPPEKGIWSIASDRPIGAPELPAAFQVRLRFSAGEHAFELYRPVQFKWTDPTAGERFRPIEVLPPVALKPSSELLAFTDSTAKELRITVTANSDDQAGQVRLELPEGFSAEPSFAPFALARKGDEAELIFKVRPPKLGLQTPGSVSSLTAVASIGEARHASSLTRIEYPYIPIQTILTPAKVRLVRVDLHRGKTTRVGYIVGAGDEVPATLRQVGYDVTLLNDEALKSEPLGRYDAIVVGIRAYNTNPRMPALYPRLMQYVRDGGTLVAQYNTRNWLSSVPPDLGPYPFEISQGRVTDEEAEVKLETPAHRILRTPNALGPADFAGWTQERGLYFAAKWDPGYETPLSMHDPNEAPLKGSLLVAKYGKGTFVYTGLSFFRQLPAGVPGAYRLLANLLDHGS